MDARSAGQFSRSAATRRRIGIAFLLCGSSIAALLVLFPSGWAINRLNVHIWSVLRENTPLPQTVTPEHLADLWNAVMFFPLGLGLALVHPRWWWAAVLLALSTAIELFQFFFLAARQADVVDVIMNTAGAGIGVVSGILIARWCENRSNLQIDSPHA